MNEVQDDDEKILSRVMEGEEMDSACGGWLDHYLAKFYVSMCLNEHIYLQLFTRQKKQSKQARVFIPALYLVKNYRNLGVRLVKI